MCYDPKTKTSHFSEEESKQNGVIFNDTNHPHAVLKLGVVPGLENYVNLDNIGDCLERPEMQMIAEMKFALHAEKHPKLKTMVPKHPVLQYVK